MKIIKYIGVTLLSVTCFGEVNATDNECIKESVNSMLEKYPESRLQDIYKFCFHDAFGPGHIIPSETAARNYLLKELSEMEPDRHVAYYEPAGCGKNFYHVDLSVITDSIVDFDVFFDAFYDGMEQFTPPAVSDWRLEWNDILKQIRPMKQDIAEFESDCRAIDELLARGEFTMHHSPEYNANYKPHYRLIKKDIFETRLLPLIKKRTGS